uniref:Uncharacterized protein n=1 Tax=Lepeophtheirus salmonis TaxID=72036 RepID=A0A0K2TK89_LEPSM
MIICISVRQILEAEKKIRVKCLAKFNCMTIFEIKDVMADVDENKVEILPIDWEPSDLEKMSSIEESNALYFVAEYIAFSLNKKTKCSSCRSLLVGNDSPFNTGIRLMAESEEEQGNLAKLIKIMSRGRLSTPTDILFLTCLYAYSLFIFITNE